jgi:putative SOS response-associated peptidase YedK
VCGRFTQERPASELAEIFGAEPLADDLGARYNVAPTDEALVVVQREDRRAITAYRWGLIPHWAEDAKVGSRMFNARSETILTSPAFRDAFVRKRCLVPVDSFYEWKREGTVRQPYRVVYEDGDPLVLAGLWAGWHDPATDAVRRTFTILTSRPNETIASLHDRMPVVLPRADWDRWLDPMTTDLDELRAMLEPRDDLPLDIYAVPRYVNDVRRDGPELIERLESEAGATRPSPAGSAPAAQPTLGLAGDA